MEKFKIPNIDNIKAKGKDLAYKSGAHFKTHWLDYLLLFFILICLGTFDIFILKRSDNFLRPEYWSHAACRIFAYIIAGILGTRLGYPKFKAECEDLRLALEKNRRLLTYKEFDGSLFSEFIDKINMQVKTAAWKLKIRKKLKKLDKKALDIFPLYYNDRKNDYFVRFLPQKPSGRAKYFKYPKYFLQIVIYNRVIKKAEKYCHKRETLERLIEDEHIKKNIYILNVKYPQVYEHDFERIEATETGYKFYKTSANVSGNAAKRIGTALIFTVIITLIIGLIAIDLDNELLKNRVLGIFTIIINAILDIGLTLWRFVAGYLSCEKIVRQEDLRSVLDQNELLIEYKKTLSSEQINQIERESSQNVVKTETLKS